MPRPKKVKKETIPEGWTRCRNPLCVRGIVLDEEMHDYGYCSACCAAHGDLGCEDCWGEDDD